MRKIIDWWVKFNVMVVLNWVAFFASLCVLIVAIYLSQKLLIAPSVIACVPWLKAIFDPSIKKRMKRLEDENANLLPLKNNIEKIFEVWLDQVLDVLRLDTSWRASFYMYDEKNAGKSVFRFVARVSDDPLLAVRGREEFPADEGVIGVAWKNCKTATYYAPPSALGSKELYAAEMARESLMPLNTAKSLTMISARVISRVVCDKDGKKKGVLVIESAKRGGKTGKQDLERRFSKLVESISTYLARLAALNADYVLCQEELKEGS